MKAELRNSANSFWNLRESRAQKGKLAEIPEPSWTSPFMNYWQVVFAQKEDLY